MNSVKYCTFFYLRQNYIKIGNKNALCTVYSEPSSLKKNSNFYNRFFLCVTARKLIFTTLVKNRACSINAINRLRISFLTKSTELTKFTQITTILYVQSI